MSKTLNIESLCAPVSAPQTRAQAKRERAAIQAEKAQERAIKTAARDVAHDLDIVGTFDQVLLADDLKAAFAWLVRGFSRYGVKWRFIAAYPRTALLAAVLAISLVLMFGYVAILAAFFS